MERTDSLSHQIFGSQSAVLYRVSKYKGNIYGHNDYLGIKTSPTSTGRTKYLRGTPESQETRRNTGKEATNGKYEDEGRTIMKTDT